MGRSEAKFYVSGQRGVWLGVLCCAPVDTFTAETCFAVCLLLNVPATCLGDTPTHRGGWGQGSGKSKRKMVKVKTLSRYATRFGANIII